jgi:hypothetical protein
LPISDARSSHARTSSFIHRSVDFFTKSGPENFALDLPSSIIVGSMTKKEAIRRLENLALETGHKRNSGNLRATRVRPISFGKVGGPSILDTQGVQKCAEMIETTADYEPTACSDPLSKSVTVDLPKVR